MTAAGFETDVTRAHYAQALAAAGLALVTITRGDPGAMKTGRPAVRLASAA